MRSGTAPWESIVVASSKMSMYISDIYCEETVVIVFNVVTVQLRGSVCLQKTSTFPTELKSRPTKLVRRQKAVESWTGIRVCSGGGESGGWREAKRG